MAFGSGRFTWNLLGAKARDVALPWLREQLPHIVAAARKELATKRVAKPERDQLTAVVKERVHAFWSQHKKRPQANLGNTPPAVGSRAERRERAQHLYTVERLLPEPTEQALAAWERQGSPRIRAWWLSDEERQRLRIVS